MAPSRKSSQPRSKVPAALQNPTEKLIIGQLYGSDEAVDKFMTHFSRILWQNSFVQEIIVHDSRVLCHSNFDKTCKSMSKLKLITVEDIFGQKYLGSKSISFIPSYDGTSFIQQCLQKFVDEKVTDMRLLGNVDENFITNFVRLMQGNAALESLDVSQQEFVCHRQDFWQCCASMPNLKELFVSWVPIGRSSCKHDLLKVISRGRIEKLRLYKISMDEEFVSAFIKNMQGHQTIEWLNISLNEILKTRPDFWDCLLTCKSLKTLFAEGILIPAEQKEAMILKKIDIHV